MEPLVSIQAASEPSGNAADPGAPEKSLVTIRASAALMQALAENEITLHDELAQLAMMHRSYSYEHGRVPTNERLEFLGDSVLGLVVTEHLYLTHPDLPEGQLAKLRAAVVNSRALAQVGRELSLGDAVLLGKGEESTGGRQKISILADTTEALIGAIYVTGGIEAARRFIHHLFDPVMDRAATLGAGLDWKTSLQEQTADQQLPVPYYTVISEGPDHQKVFSAQVHIGGQAYGPGSGANKKEAEQQAARIAYDALSADDETTS